MNFSQKLVAARKLAGYETAKDFAAALGMKYGTYLAYEQGREPKVSMLAKMCALLNTSPNELLEFKVRNATNNLSETTTEDICRKRKDRSSVYFFAFRYALSRRTFALDVVKDEWERHLDYFEDWELAQAIKEIDEHLGDTDGVYALSMMTFKAMLQNELEVRP